MKNKKNFNFIEEYKKSWNFIRESKNFIYSVIGIFFIFSLIGFFITTPTIIAEQILKFIEELLLKTKDMSQFELTKFIFFNNVQSSFFGIVFGIFLGIFPLIAVVTNGYVLGFVASLVVDSEGILALWRLFPHGIFELPAIFISLGLGLKIGTFIFQREKFESLKKYSLNSLRVFLFIVLPLLIIAAIIEGGLIYLVS
jgi:stage II sporulation protein M|tara:strand:+ start:3458 stop:4051 length:594 start_codon:yes stop_codon:yes gene_type:complete